MRKLLFKNLVRRTLTEPRPPADDAMLAELAERLEARTPGARLQPFHPRGGRGFATVASLKFTRSTTSITILSASASASWPRRATPMCCW